MGVFLPYPSLALWVSRGIHGKRRRDAFILISADDDPELATPQLAADRGDRWSLSFTKVRRVLGLPMAEYPAQIGLSAERLRETLLQDVARRLIPGAVMLIARGGRIGFVEAIGFCDREAGAPMNLDAIFRIASMTKPITSVAAMILAEEGKLQIAAPVADYLPELGAANGHGRRYVILTQHAARRNPLRERFHTVCLILAIRRQPYSC